MSATGNRLLKQYKLKFQNYYELNGGSVNVESFVKKMMQELRLGKCSLRLWGQISGQLLLLSVFADGIGSCLGLIHGETLGEVLPYYLLAFFSLYLYFSVSGLVDVEGKQEALKVTVTDFLENRMVERIKSVKTDSAYLDEVEKKARRPQGEKMPGAAELFDMTKMEDRTERANAVRTAETAGEKAGLQGDSDELEALFREFLA